MRRRWNAVWLLFAVGATAIAYAGNRRLIREAESVGSELGTLVGGRWTDSDEREAHLLRLTERLAALTVAMVLLAIATLAVAVVTLVVA